MKKAVKSYEHKTGKALKGLLHKSFVTYQECRDTSTIGSCASDTSGTILIEKGSGIHSIGDRDFQIKPRQIHIQLSGTKEKWEITSDTIAQKLILRNVLIETFSTSLKFLFNKRNQHPVADLDVTTYKKIKTELLAIRKELTSNTIFIELVNARARLIALMISIWLKHEYTEAEYHIPDSTTDKFHILVDKHYKTQKAVSFYAKHLNITPNYLGIICRKQYKMSPSAFIQERVLLEAKRLLHSSDKSVKEIAFELGFQTLSYFSYFFKSKTKLTPKEYRILLDNS